MPEVRRQLRMGRDSLCFHLVRFFGSIAGQDEKEATTFYDHEIVTPTQRVANAARTSNGREKEIKFRSLSRVGSRVHVNF